MKVHWIRPVSFLTKIVDNICNQTFLPEETVLFLPMYRVLPSCGENFATLYSLPPMGKEFWCLLNRDISPLEDRILYPVLIQEWILLPFESLTQILVKNFATICVESSLPGEIIVLSFVSSLLVLRKNFAGICVQSSLFRGRILLQLHRVSSPWENNFVRCIILYWLYQGQDSKKKTTLEKQKQKQKKKK